LVAQQPIAIIPTAKTTRPANTQTTEKNTESTKKIVSIEKLAALFKLKMKSVNIRNNNHCK